MDYEKKYKDLVKAVKELQEANPSDEGIQNWVNENVPELKESEDAEIRKEMITYLSTVEDKELIPYERWIALLEKQGEQKSALIIPKFKVGDEIKTANEEPLTITKIDDKGYWSEDLFICDFDEECIWDLVSPKPIDMVESKFKVGDVITDGKEFPRCTIEEIDEQVYYCDYTNVDIIDADKNWKLVEQKPVEWSEEDEDVMNTLIKYLTQECDKTPIPEDKEMFEREISMLKSIKDRVQPQNTWKPSVTDILLLERMANGKSNPQDFQASLYALIGQLKKLMEE